MAKTKRKAKKSAGKAKQAGKLSRKVFDRELQKLQVELERGRIGIPEECTELIHELGIYGYEMVPRVDSNRRTRAGRN